MDGDERVMIGEGTSRIEYIKGMWVLQTHNLYLSKYIKTLWLV